MADIWILSLGATTETYKCNYRIIQNYSASTENTIFLRNLVIFATEIQEMKNSKQWRKWHYIQVNSWMTL